nr:MAG TPA: hypothetical protein [Caudoviricetes sp.]
MPCKLRIGFDCINNLPENCFLLVCHIVLLLSAKYAL